MANTTIKQRQIAGGLDGWIPAGETWTYASADDPTFTFTVAADVTTKYSAGMKIKLTQGTVKYFIITAVSTYSGGNTTITVYGGTDYDLANSAITANYYSMVRSPFGFPMSPEKWSVSYIRTAEATTSTATWNNISGSSISIPIGLWQVSYQCPVIFQVSTALYIIGYTTLSTANNSSSDRGLDSSQGYYDYAGAGLRISYGTNSKSKYILLTSKTTYYLNHMATTDGSSLLIKEATMGDSIIKAVCAYL